MTSSADLARVLRAVDDHRNDPAALHRALHLALLAIDELVRPEDVGEVVRAVERALDGAHARARIGEVLDLREDDSHAKVS